VTEVPASRPVKSFHFQQEHHDRMAQKKRFDYNYLGHTGLKVSEICLGTMTFGASDNYGIPTCDEETSFKLMDRYRELGGNFLDTADVYGPYNSEKIVGSWIKKNDVRKEMIIATKGRFETGFGPNDGGLSRKHIIEAVESSLSNLQTDYIDLYQVHLWDAGAPLRETLMTLNDLVRIGKIRYIGCSNFSGWQLQKAIDLSKQMGLEMFASVQQQYNLLDRFSELETFQVAHHERLSILPWSPLKGGWLTGRYKKDEAPTGISESRIAHSDVTGWDITSYQYWAKNPTTWTVLDKVEQIAKQLNKSMAQVSLRWVMQRPSVGATIIGARNMQQLEDNCAAAFFTLSPEQMQELTEAARFVEPYPYNMISMSNSNRVRAQDPAY
jgi:aryl-alcohol dehydrogenase-like predicted oxidoreductase